MEVKLDKRYDIAASAEQAWAVLQDIRATAACMPGAQITEQVGDTHYKGTVKSKVGPAVMQFAGDIEVQGIDPATMELKMLGKGADKGGSSASMELTAQLLPGEGGHCVLAGHAAVIVNGKFAQFGGRMMNSVSDMILAQFAEVFSQKAQALQAAQAAPVDHSAAAQTGGDGSAPSPVPAPQVAAPVVATEFNALGLVWALIKNFFAGLFGKKPGP
jgi:carbon monoxide dehydrogenase subunit G